MSTAILDRGSLTELLEHRAEWCVSLFLPTDRTGAEAQRDRIQFKNLLRDAEAQLVERGMRGTEAGELLAPLAAHVDDGGFWQQQQDGLAVFVAPGFHRELRMPLAFEAQVSVGSMFTVKPLLPLLMEGGHFYVLALSHKRPRLLLCTREAVSEVALPGVPDGIEDALRYDDQARPQQSQTPQEEQGKQADERFALFHGQGGDVDGWRKVDLLRYFHLVEDAVRPVLADQHAPLVLAGVEYLLPIYREANSYPGLLDEGVTGSPDRIDARTLRDQAWTIVEPLFRAEVDAARERFGDLSATERIAVGVADAVPAACFGRVDTLFVERGEHVWGSFDADTNRLDVHAEGERDPDDVDLLDLAARRTLLNGGTVYALESGQMPGSKPVAAVLRY